MHGTIKKISYAISLAVLLAFCLAFSASPNSYAATAHQTTAQATQMYVEAQAREAR